jgi:4,5-DOPA dioxygenase extradiol
MLAAMALLEDNEQLEFFNTDIDLGSVSMRSFVTI